MLTWGWGMFKAKAMRDALAVLVASILAGGIVAARPACAADQAAPAATPAPTQDQAAPASTPSPSPPAQPASPDTSHATANKAPAKAPAKTAAKSAAKKPVKHAPAQKPAQTADKKPAPVVRDPGAARPLAAGKAVPEPAMLSARDKDLFAEAMRAAEKHDWAKAMGAVSQSRNALLQKVVQWAFLHDPGPHANFSQRIAFLTANPTWPAAMELRHLAEDTIDPSVPPSAIISWFDANPPLLTTGKVAYARALLIAGRTEEAHKVARDAWLSGIFDKDDEREFLRDFGTILTPEDHWARIEHILYDEQASAAERLLDRVDEAHATLARARIAMIKGRPNIEAIARDVPAALQGDPGLLYDRIKWHRQHDPSDAVFDLIPQFPVQGPRPDLWWRERFSLIRDALSRGRITEAYTLANNHGTSDPSSIVDAEWLAGWIALRFLKDGETALPHFEKVYDTAQTSHNVSRGAYWTGRAAESLGRPDIAADWYQRAATYLTTYYGQLGLARLKGETAPQLPGDPEPTAEERATFESKDLTRALRALLEADAKEYERPFAVALAEGSGFAADRQMVAEMLNRHARPDLGIVIARNAQRDKIELIEYGYPVPPYAYPALPEKALILAIARQESNFDPGAVSFAGARGLMQLMPDTASALARSAKMAYARAKLVTDPAYNLKLGASYLSSLVNNFNGSYMLAAAAYNAGPGRARQWVRQFGDPQDPSVDPIDWIEEIPFNETRNYVQHVMENVMIYRAVLAQTPKIAPTLEVELGRRQMPQTASGSQ